MTSIYNLQPETLNLIFNHLDLKDLLNAMNVCKRWSKVIKEHHFLSSMQIPGNNALMKDGIIIIDISLDVGPDRSLLIQGREILSKPEDYVFA